jgi:hypothetical protein
MIRCWTIFHQFAGVFRGRNSVRPVHPIAARHHTAWGGPRSEVARKVTPEIVCRDVGGMPGWFPWLIPGILAGAALGILGGIEALNGELGSVFAPSPEQLESLAMGSGVPARAQGAVMELVPPSSVPAPPIVIETQPITVPEPSSLWLFAGLLPILIRLRRRRGR